MSDWLNLISPCVNIAGGPDIYTEGWVEPLRVIYDHQLVLFEGGDFVVELEGKAYQCAQGTFIIIPPGRWHTTRALGANPGRRRWVHFDWVFQGDFHQALYQTFAPAQPKDELYRPAPSFVPDRVMTGPVRNVRRAFELHTRLSDRWNDAELSRRATARALLLELLVMLLCERGSASRTKKGGIEKASKIRHILNKLAELPLSEMWSLEYSLSTTGFSYAHQARLFKQRYGISPLNYINAVRIERIKQMLCDTDMRIQDIARHFGFKNPHYLDRMFRRYTGMTPTEYRREYS
ncbi:MAG: helix-turn-helix domain-containing protein [Chitinivibrionales bacterium]|nr:helix-turn-helix domain-containing protein [Chitinivibrionales bacterium]